LLLTPSILFFYFHYIIIAYSLSLVVTDIFEETAYPRVLSPATSCYFSLALLPFKPFTVLVVTVMFRQLLYEVQVRMVTPSNIGQVQDLYDPIVRSEVVRRREVIRGTYW
jgi:hypothetical protein